VTPYAYAQNGVAERAIRTVIQSVRSLLFDVGLPKSLWAEGASCAIYVQGFIPSGCCPGVIPLEHWMGRKQDILLWNSTSFLYNQNLKRE